MTRAARRRLAIAGLATVVTAAVPAGALAHDELYSSDGAFSGSAYTHRHIQQHGDETGHLPATRSAIEVVSQLRFKKTGPERVADVGVSPDGNTAFVAAWGGATCTNNGVHVVDIADPAKPREVAFVPSKEGSAPGEGIQVVDITTPAFSGQVLVSNNEICKDKAGFGGMNLHDVSRPSSPTPLAVGFGDFTTRGGTKKAANETHSVFAWDAGDKAYAVMVDNEEGADVDIVDITDPKTPKLVAEYDLDQMFPQIVQSGAGQEQLNEVFLHDMVVKQIGGRFIMSASYWDAGYVQLDVTNPLLPKYLGDTDFADPDREATESGLTVRPEGNGHQSEWTSDNKYVLGADEDFAPFKITTVNKTDGSSLDAAQGSDTPQLDEGQIIEGQSKFVGRACPGDAAVPAGDGAQIAVIERGVCSFTDKLAAVEAAGGYTAALVFNRQGSDGCTDGLSMTIAGGIPAFGVATRPQGFAIFDQPGYDEAACRTGSASEASTIPVGKTGDVLSFSSAFDGWGYVRLFRNGTGKLVETDTFALPQAHDPFFADGFGDLSVHEVATSRKDSRLAWLSYYAGGVRVVRIDAKERLVETGRFIAEGGSNVWGIEVFDHAGAEYAAASDRDGVLQILRYTGK